MNHDDPQRPRRPSGNEKRIRRPGGGRRQVTQRQPGLEETLGDVLEAHSAGSPTDETVRWTDLKPVQLAQQVLVRARPPSCWRGPAIVAVPCARS